jgi:small subunit ribosomal protein S18
MPRKNTKEKSHGAKGRGKDYGSEQRTPRPKPKIDYVVDTIDLKKPILQKQYVNDQGLILPRKYTGLPAQYQRKVTRAIKQARQKLLMK